MRREILLIPLVISLALSSVNALDYYNTCLDNTTLSKFMNFTVCQSENCTVYNFTQSKQCEFGCDTILNQCRQPKIMEYATFFGASVFILILAGILIKIFKRYG